MKIHKFNKLNLDDIILDKIKTIDDRKFIDLKCKYKKNDKVIKEKIFFSTNTSSLTLISKLKYNLLREHYLEVLINDMNFYNFVLDIEEKIKKLILKKSNKIFPNIEKEIDYNLIDEYFKSNIKLNKIYNNPIIKLNFIKNTKNNNTLIFYNSSKKIIGEESLDENKDISLIIRLDKIILTNYTYELDFVIEQIKILSKSGFEPERILNEYRFDDDETKIELSEYNDNINRKECKKNDLEDEKKLVDDELKYKHSEKNNKQENNNKKNEENDENNN